MSGLDRGGRRRSEREDEAEISQPSDALARRVRGASRAREGGLARVARAPERRASGARAAPRMGPRTLGGDPTHA